MVNYIEAIAWIMVVIVCNQDSCTKGRQHQTPFYLEDDALVQLSLHQYPFRVTLPQH